MNDVMTRSIWVKARDVQRVERLAGQFAAAVGEVVLSRDARRVSTSTEEVEAARRTAEAVLARLERLASGEDDRRRLADTKRILAAAWTIYAEVARLLQDDMLRDAAIMTAQNELQPLLRSLQKTCVEWADATAGDVDAAAAAGDAAFARASARTLALVGAALLLAGAFAAIVTRSITRPLGAAVALVERVSRGDLAEAGAVEGRDEVARLFAAMRGMVGKLARSSGRSSPRRTRSPAPPRRSRRPRRPSRPGPASRRRASRRRPRPSSR